jgi:hypothetical protein
MALVAESVLLSAISISGLLLHENSIHNGTNKKTFKFSNFICLRTTRKGFVSVWVFEKL